jgi:hypothetical protein
MKGTEEQMQEMSVRGQPVAEMAARPACWAQAGRSLREVACGAARVRVGIVLRRRGRRRGTRAWTCIAGDCGCECGGWLMSAFCDGMIGELVNECCDGAMGRCEEKDGSVTTVGWSDE